MGCIVLLVDFELTRRVSYNIVSLHKNTTKTKVGSITIDNEVIVSIGKCENRSIAKHVLVGKHTLVRFPKQKACLYA
ncbi:hypothetical protein Hanom_Chr07g00666041 [Helianthus anomalus]